MSPEEYSAGIQDIIIHEIRDGWCGERTEKQVFGGLSGVGLHAVRLTATAVQFTAVDRVSQRLDGTVTVRPYAVLTA